MKSFSTLVPCLLFAAGAALAADPVTLTIDATQKGYAIPANYVGLSVSRDNISGANGYEQLFNPTKDSHYAHLTNLFAQIGVKHIRTISGTASTSDPDPTAAQDDSFFGFAQACGVTNIIYSLHLFNEEGTDDVVAASHIWTTPADKALLESFALDNESDWGFHYRSPYPDPVIRGYATPAGYGYKDKWALLYTNIQNYLGNPSPAAPFSGPDTGSYYPIQTNSSADTAIDGVPFTLRCALDQLPRLMMATQHYYENNGVTPTWVEGATYYTNDQVYDPKDLDPYTGNPVAYICIKNLGTSNDHPEISSYWTRVTPIWVTGTTYAVGAIVVDPDDSDNFFEDTVGGVSTEDPASDTSRWAASSDPSLPSPLQLAESALTDTNLPSWGLLYSNALAGAGDWPGGLPFRLTESSPFSNNGGNPGNQTFATALWGLDYFFWWAMHGCAGINPFTRVAQSNSPIFQNSNGDFVAEPYAYGIKAFSLASQGTTIPATGFQISNPDNINLTGYGVAGAHDLYITIINKTFNPIGAYDAAVTINKPAGFTPTSARCIVLSSGSDGDATAMTATLGGATIPTAGNWNGIWNALPLTNGACGLTVQAASAVIVDLHIDGPTISASTVGNDVILSWATNWTGYALYSAPSLAAGTLWRPVTNTPVVIGASNTVTNPVLPGAMFYRLHGQ